MRKMLIEWINNMIDWLLDIRGALLNPTTETFDEDEWLMWIDAMRRSVL
jgi:hypothetical protein